MPVKVYKLTKAIAARILTRKIERQQDCYSHSVYNIQQFRERHKNDVIPTAVICYSCGKIIEIGSECVSRVHRSSKSRNVHYHLVCAQSKNIV